MGKIRSFVLLLVVLTSWITPAAAQLLINGQQVTVPAGASMTATGSAVTGTSSRTSMLGSVTANHGITCPYVGAQWHEVAEGIYSTSATPGNITPEINIGGQAVTYTITNIVASGNNSPWFADATFTCLTIGSSGTIRVDGKVWYTATGAVAFFAPLKSTITVDNRGYMAVDVAVTMASGSSQAQNSFTLTTEGLNQNH